MPRKSKNGKESDKENDKKVNNGREVGSKTPGISQETKNSIWGIISFGLALVSTLAFFGMAGVGGEIFSGFAKALFGWGIFLVPIGFIMLGAAFFKSISRQIYTSAFLGTLLFVLSFLALFHIVGGGNTAAGLSDGGYLGLIIGYPLFHAVGFLTSLIIVLILLFISVLIALDIPIARILGKKDLTESQAEVKDNVVIKRGNEIVDPRAEAAAAFKAQAIAKPTQAVVTKPAETEGDFIIKASKSGKWVLPPIEILHAEKDQPRSVDINANVAIIKRTLSNFGIDVEMGEVSIGPTVTQFTLRPAVGVKLSKITALKSDLSLALAAHPIRIEAPIPGKALVGMEIPNKKSALVGLRDLIDSDDFKKGTSILPIVLGRDVAGFPVYASLEKMPHLLIAGATGTGKSVGINTLLLSLLYKHSPDTLKLILVDPKRVELSLYNGIPHLITPVIVDPKKVVNALRWAVNQMEKRYVLLSENGSRDILSYNAKMTSEKKEIMPYIVIIIDELADLMAAHGRDVEGAIARLAQMARAVGIHLVVSTQRPSVEVITGLIKANITTRIAFQVASQIDSRTILDQSGAESLLGKGDMLYLAADSTRARRLQGSFVSEKEVKDVVKFIKQQADELEDAKSSEEETKPDELKMQLDEVVAGTAMADGDEADDDLYGDAKEVVIQAGKASASLLQRRLRVGYARAARLLDLLEENGVIGPGEGAKPREVFASRGATPLPSGPMEAGLPGQGYISNEPDDGSSVAVADTASLDINSSADDKINTEE